MNKIAKNFSITFSVLLLLSTIVFADTPQKGRTPSSIHSKSNQSNRSGFQESYSGQNDITQANASDLSQFRGTSARGRNHEAREPPSVRLHRQQKNCILYF